MDGRGKVGGAGGDGGCAIRGGESGGFVGVELCSWHHILQKAPRF